MKNMLLTLSNTKRKLVLGGAVVALSLLVSPVLQAQLLDNWNDGNDTSPLWTHWAGLGTGRTWTFPSNPFDGTLAYRLQSPNSGPLGPAVGSFYSGLTASDFTASVDLVGWNRTYTGTGAANQLFGVIGRANYLTPPSGVPTGYGLMVRQPTGGNLSLRIVRIGADVGGALSLAQSDFVVNPTPANAYTFVFTATGSTLKGQLINKSTGLALALQNGFDYISVVDPTYSSGAFGLGGFQVNPNQVDVTFDNFVIPEPSALALAGLGIGTLLVVRRRS